MSWLALVSEIELGEVWSDKLFGSSRIAKLWLSKDPTVEGGESKKSEKKSECSGISGNLNFRQTKNYQEDQAWTYFHH